MGKRRFNRDSLIFSALLVPSVLPLIFEGMLTCDICCSLAQSPPKSYQPGRFGRKSHLKRPDGRNSRCIPRSDKIHTPPKQHQQSPRANSPSSRGSSPSPRSRCRFNLSRHSSASDLRSPDVIIEDFLDEGQGVLLCC